MHRKHADPHVDDIEQFKRIWPRYGCLLALCPPPSDHFRRQWPTWRSGGGGPARSLRRSAHELQTMQPSTASLVRATCFFEDQISRAPINVLFLLSHNFVLCGMRGGGWAQNDITTNEFEFLYSIIIPILCWQWSCTCTGASTSQVIQTFRPHNEYVNTLKHNEQYMHASVCTFCVADIRAGHIIMNYKLKAAGDAYTSPAQKSDVNYTIIEYITHDQHVSIVWVVHTKYVVIEKTSFLCWSDHLTHLTIWKQKQRHK